MKSKTKHYPLLCLALALTIPMESAHALVAKPSKTAKTCKPAKSLYSLSKSNQLLWPVLAQRATGPSVKALQLLLNANGARLVADGLYGESTESAVRKFQKAKQKGVDGIVGAQTWDALVMPLQAGSKGTLVKIFQGLLSQNGVPTMQDGVFGAATETAVGKYTKKKGSATKKGEVRVWCYLLGGRGSGG